MGRLGGGEILLILVIALLIFGPSKLADMGKGLGEGLKNFKKGLSQDGSDADSKPAEPPAAAPPNPEPPKALSAGSAGTEPLTGSAPNAESPGAAPPAAPESAAKQNES